MRGSIGLCCCSLQICRGWSLQCCSDGEYFRTTDDAGECDIEDNYWSPMCDMTLTPMLWREEDGVACQRGRRVRDCSSQLSAGKVHQSSGRSKRSERVGGRSANPVTIFTNTIVFSSLRVSFLIIEARRHSDTIHVASPADFPCCLLFPATF